MVLYTVWRRAPLLIRVDFDPLVRFCNFPWRLLPSDRASNYVLSCFASRVLWLISFARDVSKRFVRAYFWFIVFADMSGLRLAQSFAGTIYSQKTHYLSCVSLNDRRVNVSRSERLFAFNDHINHTFSLSTSFDFVNACMCWRHCLGESISNAVPSIYRFVYIWVSDTFAYSAPYQ